MSEDESGPKDDSSSLQDKLSGSLATARKL